MAVQPIGPLAPRNAEVTCAEQRCSESPNVRGVKYSRYSTGQFRFVVGDALTCAKHEQGDTKDNLLKHLHKERLSPVRRFRVSDGLWPFPARNVLSNRAPVEYLYMCAWLWDRHDYPQRCTSYGAVDIHKGV